MQTPFIGTDSILLQELQSIESTHLESQKHFTNDDSDMTLTYRMSSIDKRKIIIVIFVKRKNRPVFNQSYERYSYSISPSHGIDSIFRNECKYIACLQRMPLRRDTKCKKKRPSSESGDNIHHYLVEKIKHFHYLPVKTTHLW